MSDYCGPEEPLANEPPHPAGRLSNRLANLPAACHATGHDNGNEWIGYREAMRQFVLKKTHLYGRLAKLVRTRRMPGESLKWSRTDLERLALQHTSGPEVTLAASPRAVKEPAPRRRKRTPGSSCQPTGFKYL